MIAVDTNVLVAAHKRGAMSHEAARVVMAELAAAGVRWCIPWPCVHDFIGVVTNRRIWTPASTLSQAIDQIDAWSESPTLRFIGETALHWDTLRTVARRGDVSGPMIHDARIAAICLQHGVDELWTADRDFGRFPQLRVRNPLVA